LSKVALAVPVVEAVPTCTKFEDRKFFNAAAAFVKEDSPPAGAGNSASSWRIDAARVEVLGMAAGAGAALLPAFEATALGVSAEAETLA